MLIHLLPDSTKRRYEKFLYNETFNMLASFLSFIIPVLRILRHYQNVIKYCIMVNRGSSMAKGRMEYSRLRILLTMTETRCFSLNV